MTPASAPAPAEASLISRQVREGTYFFLDLQPAPRTSLAVACGGREVCGPEYAVRRDGFPYLSLEFVHRGTGSVTVGETDHPMRAGTVFAYGPGVPHRIRVDPEAVLVKYFVDFSGEAGERLLRESPLGGTPVLEVGEVALVHQAFEDLLRTGRRPHRHGRRLCALLLEMLLLRIGDAAVPGRAPDAMSWSTYRACRDYIETHFAELETVGAVAEACRVSPAHLSRVFKRYHASSPYRFLVQLKMARAASLLLDPAALVKEVAGRVGYEDPYHFSKVFKRTLGVSPDTFRRHRLRG